MVVTAIALRALLELEELSALALALAPLGLGLGLIARSYRVFRYSEEIEIRAAAAERALEKVSGRSTGSLQEGLDMMDKVFNTDLRRNLEL